MKTYFEQKIKERESSNSCIYFLGLIGSATYFISTAVGFWAGAVGLLKAIVWPAFLSYQLFQLLGT